MRSIDRGPPYHPHKTRKVKTLAYLSHKGLYLRLRGVKKVVQRWKMTRKGLLDVQMAGQPENDPRMAQNGTTMKEEGERFWALFPVVHGYKEALGAG
ncbi:hypothetical protein CRG98_006726 [Punica granatum]|uniref:Uncharacterized protein n=1 Tax=Punica granatum TaxID=22663 RepID=A0A2I0KWM6_PUNGR|nr:hypothetical protein CRG98_006726 [Punica granatum]